jgi:hypothetical protein
MTRPREIATGIALAVATGLAIVAALYVAALAAPTSAGQPITANEHPVAP